MHQMVKAFSFLLVRVNTTSNNPCYTKWIALKSPCKFAADSLPIYVCVCVKACSCCFNSCCSLQELILTTPDKWHVKAGSCCFNSCYSLRGMIHTANDTNQQICWHHCLSQSIENLLWIVKKTILLFTIHYLNIAFFCL